MDTSNASVKLFFSQFVCQIHERFFHTEESLRIRGVPVSGDESIDSNFMSQKRHVYLTIADMADYFDIGASIRLEKPSEALTIHQVIEKHLQDWLGIIQREYNISPPPIDDFEKLENLMIAMEYTVKAINAGEIPRDSPVKRLSRFKRRLSVLEGGESAQAAIKHGARKYTAEIAQVLTTRGRTL